MAYKRKTWTNKLFTFINGPGWSPGKPRMGLKTDIPEVVITYIFAYISNKYHYILKSALLSTLQILQSRPEICCGIFYGWCEACFPIRCHFKKRGGGLSKFSIHPGLNLGRTLVLPWLHALPIKCTTRSVISTLAS